ncbi:MAG TPA: heme ABC exporter ATP-binding protein CcmA [Acidimicrobiales bacterium]|nr:heme ABC exporter ATP-binding protein CcmA [Acidimicrobiales bacterium]
MGSAIHLRSAMALLGRFPALAGVDLDVSQGEIVLVEGPNGAGKTSLLRACAGLLRLSAGSGTVLGVDLSKGGRPRGVGFLGHSAGLYDDLNPRENVEFRARLWGIPPAGAAAALERVGLEGRLQNVTVAQLSAGQRRRVGLAALAVVRPRLWLLDEPHAGLDASAREQLDSVLGEAAAEGAAILLASHEIEHVGRIVSRSVCIDRGRIALEPAELTTDSVHVA